MHASTEQLLTLRDGGPADALIRRHVDACSGCGERLAELREIRDALRALPPHPAPEPVWERIEAQLDRPRTPPAWWLTGAAAAAVLAVVALWWPDGGPSPDAAGMNEPPAATFATTPGESLDGLLSRSRQLEQLLRELDARTPSVMNAGTADTIAGLQDGIAYIDYGLSLDEPLSRDQSERLWRQRVDLMNTLVEVRGAQLQQVSNLRRQTQ